ncbi:hypothetical protein [Kitasatospora sp. NPDC088548]|uniref:hypothetical protein n=1 Tax=Kitasatospora sp. NPDC088548 TaxID=3364075 RepID=UPI003830913A
MFTAFSSTHPSSAARLPPARQRHPGPARRARLAGVTARATEAFEIALHYQDGTGSEACAEALLNALHVASPGIVATALVHRSACQASSPVTAQACVKTS